MTISGTDADSARELLRGLRGLVRRFSVAERADVSCCGVTVAQAAALETLLARGPMRLGELSRRLGVTASTLTRNVERLESSGLVSREKDSGDGRSFRVALTGRGRSAARDLERQELSFVGQILARLPAERRAAVTGAFRDLLVAVREATETCCPGAYEHLMDGLPRAEGAPGERAAGPEQSCGCGPGAACAAEIEEGETR